MTTTVFPLPKFREGQKVLITDGTPKEEGVIIMQSWWHVINPMANSKNVCYFVLVPAWDSKTSGSRWISEDFLEVA